MVLIPYCKKVEQVNNRTIEFRNKRKAYSSNAFQSYQFYFSIPHSNVRLFLIHFILATAASHVVVSISNWFRSFRVNLLSS